MNGHQVAVGQNTLDVDGLLWKLRRILQHGGLERLGVAGKVRVMMTKTRANVLPISFLHFSRAGQTQKRCRGFLTIDVVVCHVYLLPGASSLPFMIRRRTTSHSRQGRGAAAEGHLVRC